MKRLLLAFALFSSVSLAQDFPVGANVVPRTTSTYDLGKSGLKWDSAYINYLRLNGGMVRSMALSDSSWWQPKIDTNRYMHTDKYEYITGAKTFTGTVRVGYMRADSIALNSEGGEDRGYLSYVGADGTRWIMPDLSGTIALTSQIPTGSMAWVDSTAYKSQFLKNADSTTIKTNLLATANTWLRNQTFNQRILSSSMRVDSISGNAATSVTFTGGAFPNVNIVRTSGTGGGALGLVNSNGARWSLSSATPTLLSNGFAIYDSATIVRLSLDRSSNLTLGSTPGTGTGLLYNGSTVSSSASPYLHLIDNNSSDTTTTYSSVVRGYDPYSTMAWYVGDGRTDARQVNLYAKQGYEVGLWAGNSLGLYIDTVNGNGSLRATFGSVRGVGSLPVYADTFGIGSTTIINANSQIVNLRGYTQTGGAFSFGTSGTGLGNWYMAHDTTNDRLYMGFSGSESGGIELWANGLSDMATFLNNGITGSRISVTSATDVPLRLYRRTNTANSGNVLKFELRDAGNSTVEYGRLGFTISNAEAGGHSGKFYLGVVRDSTMYVAMLSDSMQRTALRGGITTATGYNPSATARLSVYGGNTFGNLQEWYTSSGVNKAELDSAGNLQIDGTLTGYATSTTYVNGFIPRQGTALSDTTKFVLYSDTTTGIAPRWWVRYLVGDSLSEIRDSLAVKANRVEFLKNADSTTLKAGLLKNADSTTLRNWLLAGANTWSRNQTFSQKAIASSVETDTIRSRTASSVVTVNDSLTLTGRFNATGNGGHSIFLPLTSDYQNNGLFIGNTASTGGIRIGNLLSSANQAVISSMGGSTLSGTIPSMTLIANHNYRNPAAASFVFSSRDSAGTATAGTSGSLASFDNYTTTLFKIWKIGVVDNMKSAVTNGLYGVGDGENYLNQAAPNFFFGRTSLNNYGYLAPNFLSFADRKYGTFSVSVSNIGSASTLFDMVTTANTTIDTTVDGGVGVVTILFPATYYIYGVGVLFDKNGNQTYADTVLVEWRSASDSAWYTWRTAYPQTNALLIDSSAGLGNANPIGLRLTFRGRHTPGKVIGIEEIMAWSANRFHLLNGALSEGGGTIYGNLSMQPSTSNSDTAAALQVAIYGKDRYGTNAWYVGDGTASTRTFQLYGKAGYNTNIYAGGTAGIIIDTVNGNSSPRITFGPTAGTGSHPIYADTVGIGSTTVIDASRNGTFNYLYAGSTSLNDVAFRATTSSGSGGVWPIEAYRAIPTATAGSGIKFSMRSANLTQVPYAGILGVIQTNTDTIYSGALQFYTTKYGTLTSRMRLDSAGRLQMGSGTTWTTLVDSARNITAGTIASNTVTSTATTNISTFQSSGSSDAATLRLRSGSGSAASILRFGTYGGGDKFSLIWDSTNSALRLYDNIAGSYRYWFGNNGTMKLASGGTFYDFVDSSRNVTAATLNTYTPRQGVALSDTTKFALYSDTTSVIANRWWVRDQIRDSLAEFRDSVYAHRVALNRLTDSIATHRTAINVLTDSTTAKINRAEIKQGAFIADTTRIAMLDKAAPFSSSLTVAGETLLKDTLSMDSSKAIILLKPSIATHPSEALDGSSGTGAMFTAATCAGYGVDSVRYSFDVTNNSEDPQSDEIYITNASSEMGLGTINLNGLSSTMVSVSTTLAPGGGALSCVALTDLGWYLADGSNFYVTSASATIYYTGRAYPQTVITSRATGRNTVTAPDSSGTIALLENFGGGVANIAYINAANSFTQTQTIPKITSGGQSLELGTLKTFLGGTLSSSQSYNYLFGHNIRQTKASAFTFGLANAADTVDIGHSVNIRNVALSLSAGKSGTGGGGVSQYDEHARANWMSMPWNSADTISFAFGLQKTQAGAAGTNWFNLWANKGYDTDGYGRPNPSNYFSIMRVDSGFNVSFLNGVKGGSLSGYSGQKFRIGATTGDSTLSVTGSATVTGNVNIGGILRFASTWDDIQVPLTQSKTGATSKPVWDEDSVAYKFVYSAAGDSVDMLMGNTELPHWVKPGSYLHPHIHYLQTSATDTGWFRLRYRINNLGSAPGAWKYIALKVRELTYSSGQITQILESETPITDTWTLSSVIDYKLYRIGGGATNVFVKNLGFHVERDRVGSDTELSY